MNDLWTLRDIDNRGDDGAPWETTGTPAELAGYIDGALLRDLTDGPESDAADDLRCVAREMRDGTWNEYGRKLLEQFGVYLRKVGQP